MAPQYLYFWIDERGRIVELRVTRRGEAGGAPSNRYGRSMTRDLSGSYLRLDDLPETYAEPVREHMRRTGEQQGIVEIADAGEESGGGDAPPDGADGGSTDGPESRGERR